MNHIGLFEGIGGFSLAAHSMGWQTIAWCEINPFCQQVLKYHFPKAIPHEDITKTDFTIYRGQCDILTGGFPCQPYSLAGKRLGKEDERHLWPEMLRAVREIQPRWVVGENVSGLLNWNEGMVFHEVQADLEAEGYEVQAYVLPACAINAPHRRDRVWFVALKDTNQNRWRSEQRQSQSDQWQQRNAGTGNYERICTNDAKTWFVADTGSQQLQERPQENIDKNKKENGTRMDNRAERQSNTWDATDTAYTGLERGKVERSVEGSRAQSYQLASRFICSNWQIFPTQSPICSGDDGLPTQLDGITFSKWRAESVKAYGNAIVPQVAAQIFKAIELFENHISKE